MAILPRATEAHTLFLGWPVKRKASRLVDQWSRSGAQEARRRYQERYHEATYTQMSYCTITISSQTQSLHIWQWRGFTAATSCHRAPHRGNFRASHLAPTMACPAIETELCNIEMFLLATSYYEDFRMDERNPHGLSAERRPNRRRPHQVRWWPEEQ